MKIILSIRNTLVDTAIKFDCCGLINENSLTEAQRAKLQKEIRAVVQEIDNILIPKKNENRN